MANFFKNPLVLAETVVGSIVDTRAVVLYEQPETIDFSEITDETEKKLMNLVDRNKLVELFTGIGVPYLSKINGFNMYGISYIDANVDISSDLSDHPTEKGSVITDYSIINPISAKVKIAMPTGLYTRIYNQIIKYYQEKKFILLQTKFGMYRNMVIQALPYKLENASVDRPIIELSLRQVMEVSPQYTAITQNSGNITNALDGEDNDTRDLGQKTSNKIGEVFQW